MNRFIIKKIAKNIEPNQELRTTLVLESSYVLSQGLRFMVQYVNPAWDVEGFDPFASEEE